MKQNRFTRTRTLAAACLAVVSGTLTAHVAQAQTTAVVVLPREVTASATHRTHRAAFAPRVYIAVPHRPARFLSSGVDELDESYDDTDDEFDAADADNDGFISLREARRASPDWARHFKRIDSSGDGFLTREEIEAFYSRELSSK
jgi:hypothetical protein